MRKIPAPGPDAGRVLDVIRAAGGRPMLVGGYVRDALMGVPGSDIDVEVYGLGLAALASALGRAGLHVDEVGRSFGVLKVFGPGLGRSGMDVSVPRVEASSGAGHRAFEVWLIEPGTAPASFAETSGRRDFTINSVMADPATGEIIDCHGGIADLRARVLRHTTAAFAEDPLRVLRAVQFAARFGFTMAAETAAMCQGLAPGYAELPVERVWGEMAKLGTRGVDVSAALQVLAATGWERHFPQIAALHGVDQDPRWHPEGDVHVHSGMAADMAARLAATAGLTGMDRFVVVMAALLHDTGKVTHTQHTPAGITSQGHAAAGVAPAAAFLRSIGCPEAVTARILPLVREHMNCSARPTRPAVRRLARRLVPATMAELTLVVGADRAGRGAAPGDPAAPNPAGPWLETARTLRVEERPAKGILTGDHLIAAGRLPGPAFRPVLAAALEAQDAGEFADEAGALAWLAASGSAR